MRAGGGVAFLLFAAAAAQTPNAAPRALVTVAAVAIPVHDLDAAVDWYTEVLSFRPVDEREDHGDAIERELGVFGARVRTARLRLGDESLLLQQFVAPEGRPMPVDARSNDRMFQHIAIVVRDMEQAYVRLRRHQVRHASPAPQRLPDWNLDAGGIQAFYFKDPDGHPLEILQFPPGKGDPKWQAPGDALFLGIDHTAIVVGDTEASLRFYRDGLGLAVVGASENHGAEQERLNNVFGARLRITALRGRSGPGVELLEYLAPASGRPAPIDTAANDLWCYRTELVTDAVPVAVAGLRAAHAPFVAAATGDAGLRSVFVRDPDGHAVVVRASAR
jgi:catechol 2,3-dioxygenase-like lactoylglutathione lyase family enzyme